MVAFRQRFDFVRADGRRQHLRGAGHAGDYRLKFEEPYKPLLDAGVKFYAALGNHDDPRGGLQAVQHGRASLLHVHAAGRSDYAARHARPVLRARQHLPRRRADALAQEGARSRMRNGRSRCSTIRSTPRADTAWRRAAFALPSSPPSVRRRRRRVLRARALLPALGIAERDSVFRQRRRGIAAGGGCDAVRFIARTFDTDYHFMLIEVTDEGFFFQAIDRKGETVDAGSLRTRYCGHGGPSLICTLFLKALTHSGTGVVLKPIMLFSLEARAAEQRRRSDRRSVARAATPGAVVPPR